MVIKLFPASGGVPLYVKSNLSDIIRDDFEDGRLPDKGRYGCAARAKGPVKLIKRVKIAHSFLQSVSNQFHVIILSLPMQFYKWLSKNFLKPTSKHGDIGHFNL